VNAKAAAVHVESAGVGPPVVLLHGFAMHAGLFAPVVTALAAQHRVYVVDLPGHGYSAPPRSYTMQALVESLERALACIEEPFDVLGWSLGGAIALSWALSHPARLRRIAVVGTTPAFVAHPGWPHAMTLQTLQRFGDELRVAYDLTLKRFLSLQVQGSEQGRATLETLRARLFERGRPSAEALSGTLGLLERTDLRADVGRIDQPVLVVSGDRDTLAPVAAGTWLAAALPHGRQAIIPGAAHAPFLSHRDAFLAVTQPFLDAR
jgi:pimeloyl-[acyl-carrier protein] methyl ester esterase